MTVSTPSNSNNEEVSSRSSHCLLNLSRFTTMDRQAVQDSNMKYSKPFFPPCLPSPIATYHPSSSSPSPSSSSSSSGSSSDGQPPFPSSLSLPVLAPRAASRNKTRREGVAETSASLMDFVNLMSITEVAKACAVPTTNANCTPSSRSSSTASMTTSSLKKKSILLPSAAEAGSSSLLLSTSFTAPVFNKEGSLMTSAGTGEEENDNEKDNDETTSAPEEGKMEEVGSTTAFGRRASTNHGPPLSIPQWSLTTPETMKCTISTPQAFRAAVANNSVSQKRKSPLVPYWHSTPVDGNRPLMLPSLGSFSTNTNNNNAPSCSSCQQQDQQHRHHYSHQYEQHQHPGAGAEAEAESGGRSAKKAKSCSYKTLLSNAPMLPSSPDLEDRVMSAPTRRYQHLPTVPCFSSPPSGGGTFPLINPPTYYNHRRLASSSSIIATPPPSLPPPMPAPHQQHRGAMMMMMQPPPPVPPPPPPSDSAVSAAVAAAAAAEAGLPSLDDEDGAATTRAQGDSNKGPPTKWLRMKSKKKRTNSLLCALRLAATTTEG